MRIQLGASAPSIADQLSEQDHGADDALVEAWQQSADAIVLLVERQLISTIAAKSAGRKLVDEIRNLAAPGYDIKLSVSPPSSSPPGTERTLHRTTLPDRALGLPDGHLLRLDLAVSDGSVVVTTAMEKREEPGLRVAHG